MFLITKHGVYMHGVHGLFACKEDAIKSCNKLANNDRDDYHEWIVHEVVFGEPCHKDCCEDNDLAVYSTRKGEN